MKKDIKGLESVIQRMDDYCEMSLTDHGNDVICVYNDVMILIKTAKACAAQEWKNMNSAPKNGDRIRVLSNDGEHDAWYEENLESFMGMDAEWNLLKLSPVSWRPLNSKKEN